MKCEHLHSKRIMYLKIGHFSVQMILFVYVFGFVVDHNSAQLRTFFFSLIQFKLAFGIYVCVCLRAFLNAVLIHTMLFLMLCHFVHPFWQQLCYTLFIQNIVCKNARMRPLHAHRHSMMIAVVTVVVYIFSIYFGWICLFESIQCK